MLRKIITKLTYEYTKVHAPVYSFVPSS